MTYNFVSPTLRKYATRFLLIFLQYLRKANAYFFIAFIMVDYTIPFSFYNIVISAVTKCIHPLL